MNNKIDFNTVVLVWRFDEAPEEYRNLSTNGGDEDWVVLIPRILLIKEFVHYGTPSWIEAMDSMREPQKYELENGDFIFIGSHA